MERARPVTAVTPTTAMTPPIAAPPLPGSTD
jgi:hypothetical protein